MIFKLVKVKFYFATLHVSWIPKHVIQQYNLLHWYATRYLWDVVVSALTFLLLQFDGDTSHWPSLNTLHQVSDEPVINKHFKYYLPIHCRLLLFIDVVKAMVVWGVYVFEGGKGLYPSDATHIDDKSYIVLLCVNIKWYVKHKVSTLACSEFFKSAGPIDKTGKYFKCLVIFLI